MSEAETDPKQKASLHIVADLIIQTDAVLFGQCMMSVVTSDLVDTRPQ